MAKSIQEVENPMLRTVIPFRQPKNEPSYIKCGCGRPAMYEIHEDLQPHCDICYDDAISTDIPVLVRRLQGGYDDAS